MCQLQATCSLALLLCRPHAEKYAEDQDAFFADYVKAHLKLSELGESCFSSCMNPVYLVCNAVCGETEQIYVCRR